MSELKVGAEYQENIGMADTPSSTFVAKEAETRVSCEHAFEEGDGGKTEHPSNLDPEGTDPPFKWNFDVCTNLLALMACFFASTWALVTPSSAIAFIAQAFPTEAGIAIWIGTSLTVCNCVGRHSCHRKLSTSSPRTRFLLVFIRYHSTCSP